MNRGRGLRRGSGELRRVGRQRLHVRLGWERHPWVQGGRRVGCPEERQQHCTAAATPEPGALQAAGSSSTGRSSLVHGRNRQQRTRVFWTEKRAKLLWSRVRRAKPSGSEGGTTAGQRRAHLACSPLSTEMEQSRAEHPTPSCPQPSSPAAQRAVPGCRQDAEQSSSTTSLRHRQHRRLPPIRSARPRCALPPREQPASPSPGPRSAPRPSLRADGRQAGAASPPSAEHPAGTAVRSEGC